MQKWGCSRAIVWFRKGDFQNFLHFVRLYLTGQALVEGVDPAVSGWITGLGTGKDRLNRRVLWLKYAPVLPQLLSCCCDKMPSKNYLRKKSLCFGWWSQGLLFITAEEAGQQELKAAGHIASGQEAQR